MDNHQAELATALEARGHVVVAHVDDVADALQRVVATRPAPYERGDAAPFRALVDNEIQTRRQCLIC